MYNGCGTGGSALLAASQAIESGAAEIALAVGFDKHARGAFGSNHAFYGLSLWYAERYLHEYDLDPRLLAEVAAKALRGDVSNGGVISAS